jgi:hypothetical protein
MLSTTVAQKLQSLDFILNDNGQGSKRITISLSGCFSFVLPTILRLHPFALLIRLIYLSKISEGTR